MLKKNKKRGNLKIKFSILIVLMLSLSISTVYSANDSLNNNIETNFTKNLNNSSSYDLLTDPIRSKEDQKIQRVFTIQEIEKASINVNNFILKEKRLPNYVTVNSKDIDINELTYLISKSLINIDLKKSYNLKSFEIQNPNKPNGKYKDGKIVKKEYIQMANDLVKFSDLNKRSPNHIKTSLGNIQYQTYVYLFVNCFNFYNKEKRLANYITVKHSTYDKVNRHIPYYKNQIYNTIKPIPKTPIKVVPETPIGTPIQVKPMQKPILTNNTKNTNNDVPYQLKYVSNDIKLNNLYKSSKVAYEIKSNALLQTKNSVFKNNEIEILSASLVKNLKTEYEKANVIFSYVKSKIKYSKYRSTKLGALKTLKNKYGNCVDQTHLLVAMFRASKIPVRYVHGVCTFSSIRTGHVWAQVLIGNKWYVADTTSSKNTIGTIKNWNVKTAYIKNKYIELPF